MWPVPVCGDQRDGKLVRHPQDALWNLKGMGEVSLSQGTLGLEGRHTEMEAERYGFESQGFFRFSG